MLQLNDILEQWKTDSLIEMPLDESSRQTPKLHSKYLELLSLSKFQLKKAEMEQKTLLKDKWLYYNGKLSEEEISEKGWSPDPFNGLKILKGEMDYYYDADPEIQKSEEKIEYYKNTVSVLTEIVDTIKWRHQTIGNMIKWKVFESGG
jgi:hypothetical protein|tara:strand:- start:794 stop:1237 length:444 start_codon:yes stop_codon:yes gene_type:complete